MLALRFATAKPGMMLLISLAICVAFFYSLVMLFVDPASGFFWEMALLIDVMLLGHWLEMRSVRQASGALDQLAKAAARSRPSASTRTAPPASWPLPTCIPATRSWCVPGASIPADGEIVQGESSVNEAMVSG